MADLLPERAREGDPRLKTDRERIDALQNS